MAGWSDVFGKIAQWIPGKIEKIKNEKGALLNEKSILMSKEFSASASRRIVVIDERLVQINTILENRASD